MKIMIVEDEKNIREGLADMFDWEGEGFARPVLFSARWMLCNIWKRKLSRL